MTYSKLEPCPCCGAPAAVGYSAKAQFGLHGWTADCTVCTESNRYTRFDRESAVEDWNKYAAADANKGKENETRTDRS